MAGPVQRRGHPLTSRVGVTVAVKGAVLHGVMVLLSRVELPEWVAERYAGWPRLELRDVAQHLASAPVSVLVLLASPERTEPVEAAIQQIRQAINTTVEQREQRPRFVVQGTEAIAEQRVLQWKLAGADEVLGPAERVSVTEGSRAPSHRLAHQAKNAGNGPSPSASLSSTTWRIRPEVLVEVEKLIDEAERPDETTLHTALDRLVRGLGMEYGLVAELAGDASHLSVRTAVGWPLKVAQAGRIELEEGGQSAFVLAAQEPVASESLAEETRFEPEEWLADWGVLATLGGAIRLDGEPIGLVLCGTTEECPFEPGVLDLFERLCGLLGGCLRAIDQARAEAAQRGSRTQRQRKVEAAPARSVLDALEQGVLVTNLQGRVTEANRRALRLLGREHSEVIGASIGELLPLEGTAHLEPPALDDPARRNDENETLLRFDTPHGAPRWLRVSCQAVALDDKPAEQTDELGRVYCLTDVTQRKQAEIELRRTRFRLEGVREVARELIEERAVEEQVAQSLERLRPHFPRRRLAVATLEQDATLTLEQVSSGAGQLSMRGARLSLDQAGELVEALRAGASVIVFDFGEDPRTRGIHEAFQRLGTQAAVFVPVRRELDGRLRLLLLEAEHAVRWRPPEVDLLEDAAEFLALAVRRGDEVDTHSRAREALQQAEQRLRTVLELVPDCVYSFERNAQGDVCTVWASQALQAISGLSPAELPGRDPVELIAHPEDRAQLTESEQDVSWHEGGARLIRELRILTTERQVRWVRDTRRILVHDDGMRVEGLLVDITERRREGQLAKRTRRLLHGIIEGKPLSETFNGLIRLIEEQTERGVAAISLAEEDGEHLRLVAGPGLPRRLRQMLEWVRIAPDTTLCGSAAYRRGVVGTRDLPTDPRYLEIDAAEHELHGAWVAPVIGSEQNVLATISVYLHDARNLTEFERELIDRATKIARLGVEHWRARVGLHHRLQIERTKARLAHGLAIDGVPEASRLLAMLGNLVAAEGGFWTVLAEGEPVEHVDWCAEPGTGVPMRALARRLVRAWLEPLATGQSVRIEDTNQVSDDAARQALQGYRFGSMLLVPVRDDARQLRAVVGVSREAAGPWAEQDVRALRSMAELLGRVLGRREQRTLEHEQGQLALAVTHTLPEALALIDGDSRILWHSQGWPRLLGYASEVVVGSTLTDWVHAEDVTPLQMGIQRIFDNKVRQESWTVRLMCDSKAWVLCEALATLMPSLVGGAPQLLLSLRPLSDERSQVEEISRIQHQTGLKVARQLHESIGRALTDFALELGRIQAEMHSRSEELAERVENVGAGLDQLLTEVRQMARAVYPSQLEPHELNEALSHLATGFEEVFGIRCRTRYHPEVLLEDAFMATQLYAIAQEAVHNAMHHAAAELVELELDLDREGRVVLRVSDDGDGIEETDPEGGRGLGLRIMHARARLLGAHLSIRRGSPRGSVVECQCGSGDQSLGHSVNY